MNINQAKEYIKNSVTVYLKKDEFGDYRIPVVRQRPVFLLGAPGIGKTAIMEQIAEEMGIALVSYSMTHHTRQSALGLPFISQKTYGGARCNVSEYTMSEIIATIYETMEESGVKEGILFLDEINCVSETLAPSMLQFLQYKVFGKHKVPEGWVVVTAGNPPEYNKSVREFDVVTMDRLKVLTVEADYKAWKQYAMDKEINSAVTSFLELKKDYFYHIETTVNGRSYVTARGWEDLAQIITMYEEEGIKVDESLVGQYLQNDRIVREFCAYYDLYNKYKRDYRVEAILSGDISEKAVTKAHNAAFDERLSLLGILIDTVIGDMKNVVDTSDYLTEMMPALKACKSAESVYSMLDVQKNARKKALENQERANSLSGDARKRHKRIIAFLEKAADALKTLDVADGEAAFNIIKDSFDKEVAAMKQAVAVTSERLHNLFLFGSQAFEEGSEMLVLVTELTVNTASSRFISMFGSEDYKRYNELLLVSERQSDLRSNIADLNL